MWLNVVEEKGLEEKGLKVETETGGEGAEGCRSGSSTRKPDYRRWKEGWKEAYGHGATPVGTARRARNGEELRYRQDPEGTVPGGDGMDARH